MRQFNKLLKDKLKNKDFCKAYDQNCNMCFTVWQIVDNALSKNITNSQLAEIAGVSESEILAFIEGDGCQQKIIEKLCEHFELELQENCPRFKFEKRKVVK